MRVFSRNAKDWTDKVPAIVEAMRALPVTSFALNDEGVVVDDRGLTDFERLRSALAACRAGSDSWPCRAQSIFVPPWLTTKSHI